MKKKSKDNNNKKRKKKYINNEKHTNNQKRGKHIRKNDITMTQFLNYTTFSVLASVNG